MINGKRQRVWAFGVRKNRLLADAACPLITFGNLEWLDSFFDNCSALASAASGLSSCTISAVDKSIRFAFHLADFVHDAELKRLR